MRLEKIDISDIKKIYNNIIDEESRKIFENRLLYSITQDYRYIMNIVDFQKIYEKLNKAKNCGKKLILFGAGTYGQNMLKCLDNFEWECFVDNNIKGNEVAGLRVISFDELKDNYFNDIILISSNLYYKEIYSQLINAGFDIDNIINLDKEYRFLHDKQYYEFESENNKKESFVDGGCFDGKSSKDFVEWCGGNYSNIWAFEPDLANYEICKKNLNLDNCNIYNMGLFDENSTINFNSDKGAGSSISFDGNSKIETVKLDDIIKNEEVTFIKMDIEGAELKALQGAKNIIQKQKPRLAICVYHKDEDIISIPKLLLEYNPEYKFKLRHYSYDMCETVLYAF